MINAIKPYYRKGNKYFYRKGKMRMSIERIGIGHYVLEGDIIPGYAQLPFIKMDIGGDGTIDIKSSTSKNT